MYDPFIPRLIALGDNKYPVLIYAGIYNVHIQGFIP